MAVGVRYSRKRFDRTIEDTGVLVPGIGEVYRITNPGERMGENVLRDFAGCATCPNQPKPTRNYDGVEFRFQKRFSDNWQLTTTYLYSRLYGNYSGLTSSDENTRNSPSVNRFFDGQYYSFDHKGQPVFGLLQTDRPHVFKVEGFYERRGARASGCTGSPRAARRCRPRCGRRASRSIRSAAAIWAARRRITRTDLLIQHDFRLFEQPSHQRRAEHREPVRPRHRDAHLPGRESRHLQRHRSGVLQRHVRSDRAAGVGAEHLSSRSALQLRPTSGNSGAKCGCRSDTRSNGPVRCVRGGSSRPRLPTFPGDPAWYTEKSVLPRKFAEVHVGAHFSAPEVVR